MHELHNSIKVSRAISPVSGAGSHAAEVPQIIDMQGSIAWTFLIATDSLAHGEATSTILVEDRNVSTLSDNLAVVDEELLGLELAASFILPTITRCGRSAKPGANGTCDLPSRRLRTPERG